jgi:transposase
MEQQAAARRGPKRRPIPPHLRGKRARARLERAQRDALRGNDLATWRRATAMLGVLDGTSLLEMATKLDVTQSAVTKWLAAYVERGFDGLTPTKPAGPQSRLSPEQLEDVGRLIEAGPEAGGFACGIWTARMVAELIRDRFGVRYSWKYVPELLHKLGFSVQRPRKRLSRADHEAQELWLRETFPRLKKQRAALGL